MSELDALLTETLDDHRHGWSVGTFGAIGEFLRTPDEAVSRARRGDTQEIVTGRGAMRITSAKDVRVIAYETLNSDGESWNQAVAFCLPKSSDAGSQRIHRIGPDEDAIRPEDRDAILFDIGVGRGEVHMCVRTRDAELIDALTALEGTSMMETGAGKAAGLVLKTSPHRVMLSPLARLEIYVPIPGPEGESPSGPHTHMLPKLIASGRTHAANAPIPDDLQPVLMLHPRSPWRDEAGMRTSFNEELDSHFISLFEAYALPADRKTRQTLMEAVRSGVEPAQYSWPKSRRERVQARITLRRMARTMDAGRIAEWRRFYDSAAPDDENAVSEMHG